MCVCNTRLIISSRLISFRHAKGGDPSFRINTFNFLEQGKIKCVGFFFIFGFTHAIADVHRNLLSMTNWRT